VAKLPGTDVPGFPISPHGAGLPLRAISSGSIILGAVNGSTFFTGDFSLHSTVIQPDRNSGTLGAAVCTMKFPNCYNHSFPYLPSQSSVTLVPQLRMNLR
jgi:hypothetical protein